MKMVKMVKMVEMGNSNQQHQSACKECTTKCLNSHGSKTSSSSCLPVPLCFFKMMVGNFRDAMFIPPTCVNTLEGLLNQYCFIEDSSGHDWKIKVSLIDGSLAFAHGWRDFVLDHYIVVGELVVFKYVNDGKRFYAQIFSTNGVERMRKIKPEKCREELHLDKTSRRLSAKNGVALEDQLKKEQRERAERSSKCNADDRKRKIIEVETYGVERLKKIKPEKCREELHLDKTSRRLSAKNGVALEDQLKKEQRERAEHPSKCNADDRKRKIIDVETYGVERLKKIKPEKCREELNLDKTSRRLSAKNAVALEAQLKKEQRERAEHSSKCNADDRKRKIIEVETYDEELHLGRKKTNRLPEKDRLVCKDTVEKGEERREFSAAPGIGLFARNSACKVAAECNNIPKKSRLSDNEFGLPKPPFSSTQYKALKQPIDKDSRKGKEACETYSMNCRKAANNVIPKDSEFKKVATIEKHVYKRKFSTLCAKSSGACRKTSEVKKEQCPAPCMQHGSSRAPLAVDSSKSDIKKVLPVECSKKNHNSKLPSHKIPNKKVVSPERDVMSPIKSHYAAATCTEGSERDQNPLRGIYHKFLLSEDGICHIVDEDLVTELRVSRITPIDFCIDENEVSLCQDGGATLREQVAHLCGKNPEVPDTPPIVSCPQDAKRNHASVLKKFSRDPQTKTKNPEVLVIPPIVNHPQDPKRNHASVLKKSNRDPQTKTKNPEVLVIPPIVNHPQDAKRNHASVLKKSNRDPQTKTKNPEVLVIPPIVNHPQCRDENHTSSLKKINSDRQTKTKLHCIGTAPGHVSNKVCTALGGTSPQNLADIPKKKNGHDMMKGKVSDTFQKKHKDMISPCINEKGHTIKSEKLKSVALPVMNPDNVRFSLSVNSQLRLDLPQILPFSLGRTTHNRKVIVLKDPSTRLWPVLYYEHTETAHILSGWKEFAAANNIHQGDVCEFELINETEFIIQVHISKM